MIVHPIVTSAYGIVSVQLQVQFNLDNVADVDYKKRIAAFGDPQVNIAGTFTDAADTNTPKFNFQMPTTEKLVGVTTELSGNVVRFMSALPHGTMQGPLDVVTKDPGRALQVWYDNVCNRISQAFQGMPLLTTVPTLQDFTV